MPHALPDLRKFQPAYRPQALASRRRPRLCSMPHNCGSDRPSKAQKLGEAAYIAASFFVAPGDVTELWSIVTNLRIQARRLRAALRSVLLCSNSNSPKGIMLLSMTLADALAKGMCARREAAPRPGRSRGRCENKEPTDDKANFSSEPCCYADEPQPDRDEWNRLWCWTAGQ